MSFLKIYQDGFSSVTAISNTFIDDFMPEANDAEIKVYLYLIRMISANLPVSVSDMADRFNHTEKDVLRALRYWEKKELFSLEFDDAKALTGIKFHTGRESVSTASSAGFKDRPLAPIVPIKAVSETNEETNMEQEKVSYSRDKIKAFKTNPETSQILFVAESYLKKVITIADIEALIYMYEELGFSCELIDYLLQYCVEKDKKNFSYIKTVALDWSKRGIKNVKQAKASIKEFEAAKRPAAKTSVNKNSFNQFKQTEYDFDALEKKLLSN